MGGALFFIFIFIFFLIQSYSNYQISILNEYFPQSYDFPNLMNPWKQW